MLKIDPVTKAVISHVAKAVPKTFNDFEEDLQYSVDHPEAEPLNPDGNLAAFGDTIDELSWWDAFKPTTSNDDKPEWESDPVGTPHRDPLRNVGRNDPCPCGSGKKFKKCCLNPAAG